MATFSDVHDATDHTGIPGVGGGGAVATDSIWDAAGDLAVGSGANTAAKLTIGAAGGAVSRVNGAVAWNSGTSFPTAATGDRYWRTDLQMEFFYDGTRWLSTFQRVLEFDVRLAQSATGLAATSTLGNAAVPAVDIFLEDIRVVAFASAGAFDATNHWVVTFDKLTLANAATNVATLTMNSQTSNNWKVWSATIDAVAAISAHVAFRLVATKVLSAPNLFLTTEVTYRLIAT